LRGLVADRQSAWRVCADGRAVRLADQRRAGAVRALALMRNRVVAHAIGGAALGYGTMIALTITAGLFRDGARPDASAAGLMLIPFMAGRSSARPRRAADVEGDALQAHRADRHAFAIAALLPIALVRRSLESPWSAC